MTSASEAGRGSFEGSWAGYERRSDGDRGVDSGHGSTSPSVAPQEDSSMDEDQTKPNSEDAETDMHIAINTYETAANLRKIGLDGAADELEKAGAAAAQQARQEGWHEQPRPKPDLPPGWEQEGDGPPHPASTMGVPSSGGPGGPSEPPEWPDYHEPLEPYRPEIEIEPPVID